MEMPQIPETADISQSGGQNRVAAQATAQLADCLRRVPVVDMHTHIYGPEFDGLCLWGIDELLTYHYLIAEFFRVSAMEPRQFYRRNKQQQAELVWQALFVERAPVSEAARGLVSVLVEYGLDPAAKTLDAARKFFSGRNLAGHFEDVLDRAGVVHLVMTNDPFQAAEIAAWPQDGQLHPRVRSSLRLDAMFAHPEAAAASMIAQGWDAPGETAQSAGRLRRFLDAWIARARPVYLAISFGPDFSYPADSLAVQRLRQVVIPACIDHGLPLSLMLGARRAVNPELQLAGDGVGAVDVAALENICREFPGLQVLTSVLARENQHALCVAARKFANLTPFGCWWFVNTSSLVTEMTRMRMELLGATFIAQHSDARVLEQLLYKWKEARRRLAIALGPSYAALAEAGWPLTRERIERDVHALLAGNFAAIAGSRKSAASSGP